MKRIRIRSTRERIHTLGPNEVIVWGTRKATLIKRGEQQSEVKWPNGQTQYLPNYHMEPNPGGKDV